MRYIDNWDEIEERQEGSFRNPPPGGYIAKITAVKDDEAKEYLQIEWDFTEGEWAGFNEETKSRAGFWPTILYRSYKEKALGFFKAFKTAVEKSNPGYTFDSRLPLGLQGCLMGVVLGEERYTKKNGESGKRLYVAEVRSVDAIRAGEFEIPALKEKDSASAPRARREAPASNPFDDLDDDGPLPWDD